MDSTAVHAMLRSRQKNCHHCVLIKRRCDRRMPTCSRCIEKGVRCSYARNKQTLRSEREGFAPPVTPAESQRSADDFEPGFDPPHLFANREAGHAFGDKTSSYQSIDPLLRMDHSTIWDDNLDADISPELMIDTFQDEVNGMDPVNDLWLLQSNNEAVIERADTCITAPRKDKIGDIYENCVSSLPSIDVFSRRFSSPFLTIFARLNLNHGISSTKRARSIMPLSKPRDSSIQSRRTAPPHSYIDISIETTRPNASSPASAPPFSTRTAHPKTRPWSCARSTRR